MAMFSKYAINKALQEGSFNENVIVIANLVDAAIPIPRKFETQGDESGYFLAVAIHEFVSDEAIEQLNQLCDELGDAFTCARDGKIGVVKINR